MHAGRDSKVAAVHRLEEAFTPEETLDSAKVSHTLYLDKERYVTVSGEAANHLDRKA